MEINITSSDPKSYAADVSRENKRNTVSSYVNTGIDTSLKKEDTVTLSDEAKKIDAEYKTDKQDIEVTYNRKKQTLQRQYNRELQELETEYHQEKLIAEVA